MPASRSKKQCVIDCHLHGPDVKGALFQWAPSLENYADYLKYLRECGVCAGIQNSITAVFAKTAGDLESGNKAALKDARRAARYKIRILPALIVHPAYLQQARSDIKVFRKAGSAWVGELCPYLAGYDLRHPRFPEMLKLLEDEGCILQIHSFSAPQFEHFAVFAPTLPIVLSHLGGKAEIDSKFTMAAKYKNVYLDICGSGYNRLGIIEKAVQLGLGGKILFGSDYPINSPASVLAALLHARVKPACLRDICGGNVARLCASRGMQVGC